MNGKIEFWQTTLRAQWQARREFQKNDWQLKNANPGLVKAVANGLVKHAVHNLRAEKAIIKHLLSSF